MSFRPGVAQMARRFSALVNHKTRRAVAASVERRFFLNYSNLYRRLEARGLHRDMGRSRGAQAPTPACRWPATGDGSARRATPLRAIRALFKARPENRSGSEPRTAQKWRRGWLFDRSAHICTLLQVIPVLPIYLQPSSCGPLRAIANKCRIFLYVEPYVGEFEFHARD